jgi:hypothetical protein
MGSRHPCDLGRGNERRTIASGCYGHRSHSDRLASSVRPPALSISSAASPTTLANAWPSIRSARGAGVTVVARFDRRAGSDRLGSPQTVVVAPLCG